LISAKSNSLVSQRITNFLFSLTGFIIFEEDI